MQFDDFFSSFFFFLLLFGGVFSCSLQVSGLSSVSSRPSSNHLNHGLVFVGLLISNYLPVPVEIRIPERALRVFQNKGKYFQNSIGIAGFSALVSLVVTITVGFG